MLVMQCLNNIASLIITAQANAKQYARRYCFTIRTTMIDIEEQSLEVAAAHGCETIVQCAL
jgi:hypothetical protein